MLNLLHRIWMPLYLGDGPSINPGQVSNFFRDVNTVAQAQGAVKRAEKSPSPNDDDIAAAKLQKGEKAVLQDLAILSKSVNVDLQPIQKLLDDFHANPNITLKPEDIAKIDDLAHNIAMTLGTKLMNVDPNLLSVAKSLSALPAAELPKHIQELIDAASKDGAVPEQAAKFIQAFIANPSFIQNDSMLQMQAAMNIKSTGAFPVTPAALDAANNKPVLGGDPQKLADLAAKPYVAAALANPDIDKQIALAQIKKGQVPTPIADPALRLQVFLQSLPEDNRNGILAEFTKDQAMDTVRTKFMTDPKYTAAYEQMGLNTDPKKDFAEFPNPLGKKGQPLDVSKLSDEKKKACIDALVHYPDLSLDDKLRGLYQLGVTNFRDATKLINKDRSEALKSINCLADKLYGKAGGTGSTPECKVLATGDGTGTQGLNGKQNRAISFFEYGTPNKGAAIVKEGNPATGYSVEGISSSQKTYAVQDKDKPVALHINAVGADGAGSTLTLKRDGHTYNFTIGTAKDKDNRLQTVLTPTDPAGTYPKGVTYDPASQTLTFPPGSDAPITLNVSSVDLLAKTPRQGSNFDEIQVSVTSFNATDKDRINCNFNDNFEPDKYGMGDLDESTKKDVKKLGDYLRKYPGVSLSPQLTGNGVGKIDEVTSELVKSDKGEVKGGYGTPGSTQAEQKKKELKPLRFSGLEIDFQNREIKITSFTDPVPSSLGGDGRLTDLIGKLKQKKPADPNLSNNDILSGLRAFSILEALQKELKAQGVDHNLLKDATVKIGKTEMTYAEFQAFQKAAPDRTQPPKPSA